MASGSWEMPSFGGEAMNRHVGIKRLRGAGRWAARGVLGAVLLGLAGLLGCTSLQTRLQSDDEADHYSVETIGDKTTVGNAAPIPVGGVGLVVGLEGTGGDCKPDTYRAMLENDLIKARVPKVKEVLASPDNAMVLVSAANSARIEQGRSHRPGGDAAGRQPGHQLAWRLPQQVRAVQLRFRRASQPRSKRPARHVARPSHRRGGRHVAGRPGRWRRILARKRGRIWGGGRCLRPEPFSLVTNPDQQFARVSALIANRINETFQAGFHDDSGNAVAVAKDNMYIVLRVPPQYRLNTQRFLRVVRLIPYTADAHLVDMPINKGEDHRSYRQRITDDLLDPARTVTAALRLEALGQSSKPALKKGMESHHPLVRFCSAETLAYLGDPACGEELAGAVAHSPVLRAFGLTAMASLDEAVCHVQLGKLVTTSTDDETRYGAFRALRALNPRDELVRGELLNESFWLHRVAPLAKPLIHISSRLRPEIVLFGEEPRLRPPDSGHLGLSAGEFVITASKDDNHCIISRVPLRGATMRRSCSLELVKVLHTLAGMGCTYPEAVTLLQQADTGQALSCRVRCDALPQKIEVQQLALLGKEKPGVSEAEAELIPAGQDLGVTPTLFDIGLSSHSARVRQQQILLGDGKQPKDKQTAELKEETPGR